MAMRGHPLALLIALSLYLQHVHAAQVGVAPNNNATAQQYGDSYEAQSEPKEAQGGAGPYTGSQQPYELCPDPQPADSFKQGDSTASVGTPALLLSCALALIYPGLPLGSLQHKVRQNQHGACFCKRAAA
jgi:hypothetical protein